ncbi:RNA polymerase sigma factor [Paenibacillus lactis]|uniref:RNA polymerase, sigma-24 subunit, ECF subfamily n=1 Tax=Paenibacillus lactis 154 TaxID=743719 RepID=G4HKP3_9BACL|nr:RNA polymerase sigma factor [Paenibacillus lactis]EHB59583.1 RNA polymerase, sigma-24 subunit, ECF subfamily [Paenibacillus lactis 154]
MISDQQLSERMAAGDQEAFELLVTRYHGPLLSYTTRQLTDRQKAQDIVQETFIRLIRHLRTHGTLEHVRSWLYRVALNMCKDYWKSAAYRSEGLAGEDLPDAHDPAPGAQELIERQETSHEIAVSLGTLPDVQQEIITLRFFHDLKLQEIADLVDLPLSTVKTHLYNGLRKLKKTLVQEQGELVPMPPAGRSERGGRSKRKVLSLSSTEEEPDDRRKATESEVCIHGSSIRS